MEQIGFIFYGIQLRRDDCLTSLSVLGDTFEADAIAQNVVSDCKHFQLPLRIEATGSYSVHVVLIAVTSNKT